MLDSQTASALLLAVIGLISAAGLVGTVLAFWSLGRASYRKD
ncbi:hypothetical protein [Microbacterium lacus]|uniref:Uncharacterized protein n=1 Tax=Microbacterium lacus TaxID=415217 RepID=A0ABN2GWJ0_9MICO